MKKTVLITLPIIVFAKELPLIQCNNHNIIDIDSLKSERLISPNSQGSEFYFKVKQGTKKVFITEKPRASQISKDLVKLIKIGTTMYGIKDVGMKTWEDNITKECILYKQGFKKASVQLATIDNKKNSTLYNFKVGDIEQLYLTADMPVTTIKELSYDKQTNSIYENEQPSSFYLGINYKFGDIYTNYPINEFYRDLSLKAMINISNKPTESMGLGFGYHLTDGIEIFIAKVWTQNGNIVGESSGHTPTTTYGVSFDLNKGLEWVQNIYQ